MLSPQWIERVVGWLGKVFLQEGPSRPASAEAGSTLRRWRCHVQRFFYRIYAGLRIEELFSIIRDFPDSRPAIEDLKYCLERTDQRQQLLVSLKAALETRLLHPGPPRLPARPSSRGPDPGARGPGSQPRGLRRVG